MTNAERDSAAIPLLTESIRGNREALGDLIMLFRPVIGTRVYLFLSYYGLEQSVDDVVQEAFIKIIKDFRLFIPRPHLMAAGFQAWAVLLTRTACLQFLSDLKTRTARWEIPIEGSDDEELKASTPADSLSMAAWEQESTQRETPPPSQSRRTAPRRGPTRKNKTAPARNHQSPARPWNKKTRWEVTQINRQRAAYLNTSDGPAVGKDAP